MERSIGVYSWKPESAPSQINFKVWDLDHAINTMREVSNHANYLDAIAHRHDDLWNFLRWNTHFPPEQTFPIEKLSKVLEKEKEKHPEKYSEFFIFVGRCHGQEMVDILKGIEEPEKDISKRKLVRIQKFAQDLSNHSRYVPAKGIVGVVNRLGKADLTAQRYHLRLAFDGNYPSYMNLMGLYLQELRQEQGANLNDLLLDHSEGHGLIGLIRNNSTHDVLIHDKMVDVMFDLEQRKIYLPGTKDEESRNWAKKIVGGERGSSCDHQSEVAGALIEKYLERVGLKDWKMVYSQNP